MTEMQNPSYLSTMNAIANGERGGYELLNAWAQASCNEEVACRLATVAVREHEHSVAFEKRMCELGFTLKRTENEKLADNIRVACNPDLHDAEKMRRLGITKLFEEDPNAKDELLAILSDKSIDPQTGALFGRFICEERDSVRLLKEACEIAHALEGAPQNNIDSRLDALRVQLESLSAAVARLADPGKSRVQAVR